jgi:capsule polysaccharide export protein KpsC/LpsZ
MKFDSVLILFPLSFARNKDIPSVNEFYKLLLYTLSINAIPFFVLPQKKMIKKENIFNIDKFAKEYQNNLILSYHTTNRMGNVINTKISYLPDYFYFDSMGYSGWSEAASDENLIKRINEVNEIDANDFYKSEISIRIRNNQSKYPQNPISEKIDIKYVFLPTQVIDDSVSLLSYIPQQDFIEKCISVFSGTEYKLVIKRHPYCRSVVMENLLKNASKNSNVIISNKSIHNLIKFSEAVLTINSGVGFESLMHGKRVFLAGKSDYEIVCKSVKTLHEISDIPTMIKDWEIDILQTKKFLYYFLNTFLVHLDFNDMNRVVQGKIKPYIKNL